MAIKNRRAVVEALKVHGFGADDEFFIVAHHVPAFHARAANRGPAGRNHLDLACLRVERIGLAGFISIANLERQCASERRFPFGLRHG